MALARQSNRAARWLTRRGAGALAFLRRADDVLRAGTRAGEPHPHDESRPPAAGSGRSPAAAPALVGYVLAAGAAYGAVMGAYGAGGGRWLQPLFSALKVPLLLLVTYGLSLPSFWVLNLLLGVGADFARVARALLAAQAGLTLVLAALAPLTAVWYASASDYHVAILFNAAMFALASLSAQYLLRRAYRPLARANPVHGKLLRLWLVIYAFVGIQMGWVLRPFVGDPGQPAQFFRRGSWGNAYVEVAGIIRQALGR